MSSGIATQFKTAILRVAIALFVTSIAHADTTASFQNGLNGYSGAQDISINTQYSQYNGGNGTQWRGDPELGCYTTTGTGAYAVRYLVKFCGLSVPAGSTVTSATLTISLDSWNSGKGNITGFYLKNSWDGAFSNLGWLHRDGTHDWAGAGASAAGVDTVAGKTFQVPPLRPVGPQTVTIPLDLAQVQSWIDSPGANQGIMLVNNNPGEIIRPVSTVGAQSMRPKLVIVIAGAVSTVQVGISPASATLPASGKQTFTATVTGPSNTAVTWTATGGTISSAGVFTAGNTAGNFTVTATSAADPAKSATASVSIQAVQVSISPSSATLQAGQTQQFAAAVTRSSNTAVKWTATGGTVTNSGLFTAGSTAGSFNVTATSVADATKLASASVVVKLPQPPPPPPSVQVSVTPAAVTVQPAATQQFTATVTGSSNTAVTWSATGGAISPTGLYTAGQSVGSFAVTATAKADTTKSATVSVSIANSQGLPPIPRMNDGAYVVIQSPVAGMHFTAPATIRMYADPFDINAPDPDALTVNFLMNGQSVGTFTGSDAQNGYFALTATNVAAGTYAITAQINAVGKGIVTSAPVTIVVDNPPASSGPIFNLTSDVVLSGAQSTTFAGTPANHCAINGNGFQIRSATGFTGSFTISNCDVRGLGTATNPAINVTVNGSGSAQLIGNVFDTFGTVSIGANDTAQVTVRGNEFRENTLVPVGSLPEDDGPSTLPVFHATGSSSAQQLFQANNVGLSTVVFENTRNWLIGGNTDADSNVLMGVRCGFRISGSSNMVLRGNYSQHNYPHRFSQGENFQLDGDGFLAEHNVIRSSSWPVRGMGGELRYNLIDASGNSDQVVEGVMSNINIHHNVFSFTVSQTLYSPGAGLKLLYSVDNVQFRNNVMDGGGTFMGFSGSPVSVTAGSFIGSLRNNVFYNFAGLTGAPILAGDFDESTNPPLARLRYSDYHDFFNPDAPNQTNYGLSVVGISPGAADYGLHDLGGFNGHANPKFTQPTALPFPFLPEDIWSRRKTVSDVLSTYRMMYAPAAGSPLLGAGDPQDGAGGNIGAVGNGEPADQFGRFGTGAPTPGSPVITTFTASPSTIQSGQSATLSWSTSGATTLTIAPLPGTVTGNSVVVNPSATTTYTLTAANSSGSVTATATVTVSAPVAVGVSISPASVSVVENATNQFTATVTGASNTAVTWTASGGTISSTGLYSAGAAAGSFTVTATSVQDATTSASAAVTVFAQAASSRPRIILDAPTLSTLRGRMQSATPEWKALKSVCDSYASGGTVSFPDGNAYPDPNGVSVGEGYQGDGYVTALMPLGVCYQTVLSSDPTTAAKYGAKAVAILIAMSDPNHEIVETNVPIWNRDSGYGIRNYGFAMGVGYDWFHDLMTPTQLSQLLTALTNWISAYETNGFGYNHPQGNYFAGYYVAKCMAALAVQGDSAIGDSWWNDWYNNQHLQRVQPYYAANMSGGGWTEGYTQYGILGSKNMSLPALAVKTAKGIDIIRDAQHPYAFPLDQGRYLLGFTWPTRDMLDDRGELYNTGDPAIWPGTTNVETYHYFVGFLALWGDPSAPFLHKYARDVKTALAAIQADTSSAEWLDFLFWDETAPESDYTTLPISYFAPGIGGVTARSDWSNSATFMSFISSPYINNPDAGHELFDKGSLAIERNRNPLLVNPPAWLAHDPNGNAGWTLAYNDRYGNSDVDPTFGNARLYNTFQVRHIDAQGRILDNYGEWSRQRSDGARTQIGRFEDGGSYVLTVGQYLEDMYKSFQTICSGAPSSVTSWSRQIVYLRPSQFVVYDRTGICDPSLDQYLAFHFAANPAEAAPPAAGLHRFDVNTGTFAGSMTTILPANAATVATSQLSTDTTTWNKVWRMEIRATDAPAAAASLDDGLRSGGVGRPSCIGDRCTSDRRSSGGSAAAITGRQQRSDLGNRARRHRDRRTAQLRRPGGADASCDYRSGPVDGLYHLGWRLGRQSYGEHHARRYQRQFR